MLDKKLAQITTDDLKNLFTNQVRESKTLEYKREFPKGDYESVKDFLAGISALANTSGGDFLIGVEAKDGIPVAILGVPLSNPDQEELRLENWLRDGLEPRLPRCDIRSILIDEAENYVIIVRVPQSWNAPHRVTYKGHDKFYGRTAAGKYPLDVSELRTAFTLSEQISERIRNFRVERIAAVYGNEGPVQLPDYGKLILHIIPLSAFTAYNALDITTCYYDSQFPYPLGRVGGGKFVMIDGVVCFGTQADQTAYKYTLVFRNGILESVSTFLPLREQKVVPAIGYEEDLIKALPDYLKFLTGYGIEPPFYLFVTLVNMKGYLLGGPNIRSEPLRLNIIQPPEIVLETIDNPPHTILRPAFDMIWNAFGALRSLNYDQSGNWKGRS